MDNFDEFDDDDIFDEDVFDDEKYDFETCLHEDVDSEGVCCKCSMSIGVSGLLSNVENYTDYSCNLTNVTRADFEKDLAPLKSIPEEIKRWICEYSTMSRKSICRLKNRKVRIFSYIILGYLKHGLVLNRREIIDELKIDKKSVNEAVKAVGSISQKELPQPKDSAIIIPYIVEKPVDYLKEKLTILNNQEMLDDYEILKEFTENLTDESNFILEEEAEPMCIAIIKYYMDKHSYDTRKLHLHFDSKIKKINDSYEVVDETYKLMVKKYSKSRFAADKLIFG